MKLSVAVIAGSLHFVSDNFRVRLSDDEYYNGIYSLCIDGRSKVMEVHSVNLGLHIFD